MGGGGNSTERPWVCGALPQPLSDALLLAQLEKVARVEDADGRRRVRECAAALRALSATEVSFAERRARATRDDYLARADELEGAHKARSGDMLVTVSACKAGALASDAAAAAAREEASELRETATRLERQLAECRAGKRAAVLTEREARIEAEAAAVRSLEAAREAWERRSGEQLREARAEGERLASMRMKAALGEAEARFQSALSVTRSALEGQVGRAAASRREARAEAHYRRTHLGGAPPEGDESEDEDEARAAALLIEARAVPPTLEAATMLVPLTPAPLKRAASPAPMSTIARLKRVAMPAGGGRGSVRVGRGKAARRGAGGPPSAPRTAPARKALKAPPSAARAARSAVPRRESLRHHGSASGSECAATKTSAKRSLAFEANDDASSPTAEHITPTASAAPASSAAAPPSGSAALSQGARAIALRGIGRALGGPYIASARVRTASSLLAWRLAVSAAREGRARTEVTALREELEGARALLSRAESTAELRVCRAVGDGSRRLAEVEATLAERLDAALAQRDDARAECDKACSLAAALERRVEELEAKLRLARNGAGAGAVAKADEAASAAKHEADLESLVRMLSKDLGEAEKRLAELGELPASTIDLTPSTQPNANTVAVAASEDSPPFEESRQQRARMYRKEDSVAVAAARADANALRTELASMQRDNDRVMASLKGVVAEANTLLDDAYRAGRSQRGWWRDAVAARAAAEAAAGASAAAAAILGAAPAAILPISADAAAADAAPAAARALFSNASTPATPERAAEPADAATALPAPTPARPTAEDIASPLSPDDAKSLAEASVKGVDMDKPLTPELPSGAPTLGHDQLLPGVAYRFDEQQLQLTKLKADALFYKKAAQLGFFRGFLAAASEANRAARDRLERLEQERCCGGCR